MQSSQLTASTSLQARERGGVSSYPPWHGMDEQWRLACAAIGCSQLPRPLGHAAAALYWVDTAITDCATTWRQVRLVYLSIFKGNSMGFCAKLLQMGDNSTADGRQVTFTFVREPIAHFVSGYSEFITRVLSDRYLAGQLHARSYMRWVHNASALPQAMLLALARGQVGRNDAEYHMYPQVGFLANAMWRTHTREIDFVGRLESSSTDWMALGEHVVRTAHGLGEDSALSLNAWPSLYQSHWHPQSDSSSHSAASQYRLKLRDWLEEHDEATISLCHLLLGDYACLAGMYALPHACARVQPTLDLGAVTCAMARADTFVR